MNFINRLSLNRQMTLLIAIAMIGMGTITAFSWSKMGTIYKAASFAQENTLPAMQILNEMDDNATELGLAAWEHITQTDEAAMAKLEEEEDAAKQRLDDNFAAYEPTMAGESPEDYAKDKAYLDANKTRATNLYAMLKQVRELSRKEQAVAARDLFISHKQDIRALGDGIDEHADFNIKLNDAANREALQQKQKAIVQLLLTALVTGALATWLGYLIARTIKRPVDSAVLVAEQISEGRVGNRIDDAFIGDTETGRLMRALRAMDEKLYEIVGAVSNTAESVGSAARQIAQGNDDLSSRTQEQASALEETAATMEEMTATVKRNSDNAHQADQLGRQARHQADSSTTVVQQAMEAMQDINTASRKIGDIINVIDEIAFQTNLLALNAAVEAARAGEQGRGFAVVASEVRNLAQRSATAAKEIKSLINDSVAKVNAGSELVNASGKALNDIVTDVKRVTDIVAEIAAASTEQSEGINQINHAVTQMDATTQQNAALVEEAASASKAMEHQAMELVERISFFTVSGQQHAASVARHVAPKPARAVISKPKLVVTPAKPEFKRAVGSENWSEF